MSSRRFLGPALIVLLVSAVFGTGLDVPYLFDDHHSIPENPYIRALNWDTLASAPDQGTTAGRPVVQLSLAIGYALHGLDVRGHHVANILLHVIASLLLFDLVRRVLSSARYARHLGPAANGIALATSLIWALHPLQTEAVTYLIQRTELLKGVFLLATMDLALIGFAAEERPGGGRVSRRYLVAAVITCLLGMGSKESMVGAPLLVLLADRAFASGSFREAWRRHRAFYLGLMLTWMVVVWSVARGSRTASVGFDHGIGPIQNLLTQAGVLVWYVRLSIWPDPLAITYDWPVAQSFGDAWLTFSIMGLLFAVTVLALVRRPGLGVLGAWFFVILGPTSSFVPISTEMVAERRMYLPLAAIVLLGVVGAWQVLVALATWRRDARAEAELRAQGRTDDEVAAAVAKADDDGVLPRWPRAVAGVLVGLVVLAGAAGSVSRIEVYADEYTIWTDTLLKQPRSHFALTNMALVLRRMDRAEEALLLYGTAIDLDPDYPPNHIDIGNNYLQLGRAAEALGAYDRAIRLEPNIAAAHHNRAMALVQLDRIEDAIIGLVRAVDIDPLYADAHANLAVLLVSYDGDSDLAAMHLTEALRLHPENVAANDLLVRLQGGA